MTLLCRVKCRGLPGGVLALPESEELAVAGPVETVADSLAGGGRGDLVFEFVGLVFAHGDRLGGAAECSRGHAVIDVGCGRSAARWAIWASVDLPRRRAGSVSGRR